MKTTLCTDRQCSNWQELELPDTWADQINFNRFSDIRLFARKIMGRQIEPVRITETLPLNVQLPKYLLQEFHNLPNGNYSKKISRGYASGFDRSMLGKMAGVREKIARDLQDCHSVVDIGCGAGHSANSLLQIGVAEVWGLDASPYLLKHAATDYADINFIQGLAENTGFEDQSVDGVSCCFLFHEIPPKHAKLALDEFARILKPKGLVSIAEPSPVQLINSYWKQLKSYGWQGVYFKMLANHVYEPFVNAWHNTDYMNWAEQAGFELVQNEQGMPVRHLLLRKK